MYIIIVGGGRLGYYLTKTLLAEGHEALIIEKDAAICDGITTEMGGVCVRGDGCEVATLTLVGTGRADMLVAVTGDDEDNLVACQVAKYKFNVPRTIARIRNPQHEPLFQKLGVDVTVTSTNLILEAIQQEVPTHPLTHLLTIRDKKLVVVEIKIPPGAATVDKAVKQISLPPRSKLALLLRKGLKPLIPTASTVLQAEDRLIAVVPPESEEALRQALIGA